MMKKIYLLCVMLITMCLTFGCGSDESTNEKTEKSDKVENSSETDDSQDESSQEVTTADEFSKKPDEERMLNDLTENQCNTISFTGTTDTITIPIESMKLDKAKEEDEKYIAYCTLQLKNECYEGSVTYCLNYEYYDIGGWQLNDWIEESRDIQAIAQDDIKNSEYIKSYREECGVYEPTDITLVSATNASDDGKLMWECKYDVSIERKYADIFFYDTVICCFDQNTGWNFEISSIEYIGDDWTKMEGKKFYTGVDEGESYYIEILDIDTMFFTATASITGQGKGWYDRRTSNYVYDIEYQSTSEIKIEADDDNIPLYYMSQDGNFHDEGVYWVSFDYDIDNNVYDVYVDLILSLDPDFGIAHVQGATHGFHITEALQEVE